MLKYISLPKFFNSVFKDFKDSIYEKYFRKTDLFPWPAKLIYEYNEHYNLITNQYNFQTNRENYVQLCIFLKFIQLDIDDNNWWKENKKNYNNSVLSNNRLVEILNSTNTNSETRNSSNTIDLVQNIQFKLSKDKTIKIEDKKQISTILAIIKESKKIQIQKDYFPNSINIMRDAAKMFHKYFEKHSTLNFKSDSKTSDEICRVIYELFLQYGIILKKQTEHSDNEDYIRVNILRSLMN